MAVADSTTVTSEEIMVININNVGEFLESVEFKTGNPSSPKNEKLNVLVSGRKGISVISESGLVVNIPLVTFPLGAQLPFNINGVDELKYVVWFSCK